MRGVQACVWAGGRIYYYIYKLYTPRLANGCTHLTRPIRIKVGLNRMYQKIGQSLKLRRNKNVSIRTKNSANSCPLSTFFLGAGAVRVCGCAWQSAFV